MLKLKGLRLHHTQVFLKVLIVSLSLLFFIDIVSMELQLYTYITCIYSFPILEVVRKPTHRYEYIFPSLVVIGSTVVQNAAFFFFYSKSVSGDFSLVDCSPCILMFRCTIVVFLNFSKCFFMSFSVRPVHFFRKPCLIALRRLAVVGLKSAACKYWASSGLEVCAIIFYHIFLLFCPQGNLPHSSLIVSGAFDSFHYFLMDWNFFFF